MKKNLEGDERVTESCRSATATPGRVYFRDPEFNGVEVFIDTPWHVRQPQGEPLDLDKSNEEIVEATRAHFSTEPEFGAIEDFYRRRAEYYGKSRQPLHHSLSPPATTSMVNWGSPIVPVQTSKSKARIIAVV